jgi:hypothetical protein
MDSAGEEKSQLSRLRIDFLGNFKQLLESWVVG